MHKIHVLHLPARYRCSSTSLMPLIIVCFLLVDYRRLGIRRLYYYPTCSELTIISIAGRKRTYAIEVPIFALNNGADGILKGPKLFLVIYASQPRNSELYVRARTTITSILKKFTFNRIQSGESGSNTYLVSDVANAWGRVR